MLLTNLAFSKYSWFLLVSVIWSHRLGTTVLSSLKLFKLFSTIVNSATVSWPSRWDKITDTKRNRLYLENAKLVNNIFYWCRNSKPISLVQNKMTDCQNSWYYCVKKHQYLNKNGIDQVSLHVFGLISLVKKKNYRNLIFLVPFFG